MDTRELDRLVSKTELTPSSKLLLKTVRRSLVKGRVRGPNLSSGTWSVEVEDFAHGRGARFTFKFRRDKNGESPSK